MAATTTTDEGDKAAQWFLKGIQSLARLFLLTPAPYAQLMTGLLRDFVQSRGGNVSDDEMELLAPIFEKLQSLQPPGE